MLGVFAEFETNLRRERQFEGVARAKKEGKYKGRKPTVQAKSKSVVQMINQGFTRQAIAEQLNIGIASVYRILKSHKNATISSFSKEEPQKKVAIIEIWLSVENNSKFVRGKNKSREEIERHCFSQYDMKKTSADSWDYILKIPYTSDEELKEIIDEIMSEASGIADRRNGFIEMDVSEPSTGKSW